MFFCLKRIMFFCQRIRASKSILTPHSTLKNPLQHIPQMASSSLQLAPRAANLSAAHATLLGQLLAGVRHVRHTYHNGTALLRGSSHRTNRRHNSRIVKLTHQAELRAEERVPLQSILQRSVPRGESAATRRSGVERHMANMPANANIQVNHTVRPIQFPLCHIIKILN